VRARLLRKPTEGRWLAPDSPLAVGVANSAVACKDPRRAICPRCSRCITIRMPSPVTRPFGTCAESWNAGVSAASPILPWILVS
jgi:hypothetical protein